MVELCVGVLGASSLVGECLLPMLRDAGWRVVAFSRHPSPPLLSPRRGEGVTPYWICVAPIWVLPDYFALIEAAGARRVVVLSSTSRFIKVDSGDTAEQATAAKLIDGETRVQAWAESRGIEWVILRPTLIYRPGCGISVH